MGKRGWLISILVFAVVLVLTGGYIAYEWLRPHSDHEFRAAFTRLVFTHPKREVREHMKSLFDSGEMEFMSEQRLLPQGSRAATIVVGPREGVFVLEEAYLFQPRWFSEYDIQVTLWHEYQHMKQIIAGEQELVYTILEKSVVYGDRAVDPVELDELGRMRYRTEVSAYVAGCELAAELGKTDKFELCQIRRDKGEAAFRQYVGREILLYRLKERFPRVGAGIEAALAEDPLAH